VAELTDQAGAATRAGRRADRIRARARNPKWRNPPRRIDPTECIGCDTCLRHCPPQFGAIFNHGLDVVIIPELCSGCPHCVAVCPVDCIYVDHDWQPTPPSLWAYAGTSGDPHVARSDR
jgi:Na+-translocating ferredoxin:NAD+ oxidoreductase subunit B